jgi:hypothetical protein
MQYHSLEKRGPGSSFLNSKKLKRLRLLNLFIYYIQTPYGY